MINPYYMQQTGVVNAAARCASVQKSHGVFSRKHMESYLQYTVRSMFAFGLDSAVQLDGIALQGLGREKKRKRLWAHN
jgi:hypothetical protein